MSDESKLSELNTNIAQWEQQRDEEGVRQLDGCLSTALLFRRADRSVVDKAAFMNALKNPSPFTSRESRDVTVNIVGDRALATLTVIGTKKDGSRGVYRNVRLFFRRDGKWTMEFWFNDDVTSVPATAK